MGNCFLYKRGMGSGGGIIPEIEKTVLGKLIAVSDSADKPLKGLRIFGKTTQNGTPSPDAPVPLVIVGDGGSIGVTVAGKNLMQNTAETKATNGITFTVNDDGSVTANGTATATAFFNINTTLKLSEGTRYILSGCPPYTGVLIVGGNYGSDSGNGMTFTALSTAASALSPAVYLRIASGTTVDNIVFKPMLRLASVADNTYEPYKGQALTVSTPNGLPGIHVSEGGNYTDENGWQWVCDEVDFAGRKYVQRVGRIASYAGENLSTAYMSATGSLSNGAEILYVLAAPIETPLSSEEFAQYAALYTYSPTTTIYNDGGAYMELKYIAKGG